MEYNHRQNLDYYENDSDIDSIISAPQSAYTNSSGPEFDPEAYHNEKNMAAEAQMDQRTLVSQTPNSAKTYLWPATTLNQGLYLSTSILSTIVVLGLEIYIFYVFMNHLPTDSTQVKIRSLETYLGLFIFASFYQLIITYISILNKNFYQICILLWFLIAMIAYSGIQYGELAFLIEELQGDWKRATRAAMVLIIVMLCIAFIFETFLALQRLQKEFNWQNYKNIGTSLQAKKFNTKLQFYKSMITFDAFFFPAFTIQFIIINIQRNDPEFYITIVMLPLTFIILYLALIVVKREQRFKKWLYMICIIAYLVGLVYVFFKVIRLYTYAKYEPHGYLPGRVSLTAFGAITIMLLICTMILTVAVYIHSNKNMIQPVNFTSNDNEPVVVDRIFNNQPKPALIID